MQKNIGLCLLVLFLLTGSNLFSQDKFADIGTRKYETREHLLIVPQPPVLPEIYLPVSHNPQSVFKIVRPLSSKEELYNELTKLRKQFEPFMQNLAPIPQETRFSIPLTEFSWRKETRDDITDFAATARGEGEWEKVNIPHYGPPLGRAVTYYFKEVELTDEALSKGTLFICFKGVDYKATVFINGSFCGIHEGFFAPFEFDITKLSRKGRNQILIKVENDYSTTGSKDDKGNTIIGDKIYAATGPGYDDPVLGWHHGPAAMGIYQDCFIESRATLHINDIFVRPRAEESKAEAWIEINNFEVYPVDAKIKLSVYGQNFPDTVIDDFEYIPSTTHIPGVGDLAKPTDWVQKRLKMGYGVNFIRVPIEMKNFRYWDTQTPWLYQLQVKLYDEKGNLTDTRTQHFGMRSFTQDTISIPKGRMYLNGKMIRLRGANTMGHEQQCVMKKDFDQLRNDILLARLCNMNYIRFTQRPVQSEVYDMCDKLGMLNQADFPLFGSIRRNKFAEAVKQAEEFERLVRKHPSTIIISYINERFPNAEGNPQRSLNSADEYYRLFSAFDQAVLLSNPERIIKPGDGDYDPPSPGLPDSHCYNTWYNGHGLGLGQMYKGFWQPVKPDWLYACGEFGAEGLDPVNVMKKYYPKDWLPQTKSEESEWTANRISMAQTHRFHYMWYNSQNTLQDWIDASQDHQAWAVKFVAETFRRDPRMVSFAVHLFIDAWPAGWMKTIMDVDRQPKKAYFAYRNALEPLMVSLRSDRNQFFRGEETAIELWVCNDRNEIPDNYTIKYQLEQEGRIIFANQVKAQIPENSSQFQGFLRWKTPMVNKRTTCLMRIALINAKGESEYQNKFSFDVFPEQKQSGLKIYTPGKAEDKAAQLINQAGLKKALTPEESDVIIVDDYEHYKTGKEKFDQLVKNGKILIFLELPANSYVIGNKTVIVEKTQMGDYYFVSPKTGHKLVKDFKPFDFKLWYNGKEKYIAPLLANTISAPGWDPVLSSGSSNWIADKGTVMASGEFKYGNGLFRICEIQLIDRINFNPTASIFFNRLISH